MQFNYRSYLGYRGYYGCNVLSQINENKEIRRGTKFFERLQVFYLDNKNLLKMMMISLRAILLN